MSEFKVSAAGFLLRPLDWLVVGYLPLCLHIVFPLYVSVFKFPHLTRTHHADQSPPK